MEVLEMIMAAVEGFYASPEALEDCPDVLGCAALLATAEVIQTRAGMGLPHELGEHLADVLVEILKIIDFPLPTPP
jgi:hypothetical protein